MHRLPVWGSWFEQQGQGSPSVQQTQSAPTWPEVGGGRGRSGDTALTYNPSHFCTTGRSLPPTPQAHALPPPIIHTHVSTHTLHTYKHTHTSVHTQTHRHTHACTHARTCSTTSPPMVVDISKNTFRFPPTTCREAKTRPDSVTRTAHSSTHEVQQRGFY